MIRQPRSYSIVAPSASQSMLGRGHGLLLVTLGGIVLAVLLRQTEGHRARLAAEALGIVLGGCGAALVFGCSRPSPHVVTRAYILLGRHTRRLLVAGMVSLFGFAVATAAVRRVAPQLREFPGLGGLVTLDWVLSLTALAIAGSTLLCVGAMALVARSSTAGAAPSTADGIALERLWAAANGSSPDALRACFVRGPHGETLYRHWSEFAGPLGSSQVILVRSAAASGRTWSEWCARSYGTTSIRRWILLAMEQSGQLSGDGEVFQYVPRADVALAG